MKHSNLNHIKRGGEQGWHSGDSGYLLLLWFRFNSQTWHHTPTPQIPINFDLETMDKRSQEWNVHCLIPIYLFLPIEMERATIEKQVLVYALIL